MSTYRSRLLERKAQFVVRYIERLARTVLLVESLSEDPTRLHDWQQVCKDFHQLAGAAGIYEMAKLSALAVQAEDTLSAALRDGAIPGPADIAAVQSLLRSIDETLRADDTACGGNI